MTGVPTWYTCGCDWCRRGGTDEDGTPLNKGIWIGAEAAQIQHLRARQQIHLSLVQRWAGKAHRRAERQRRALDIALALIGANMAKFEGQLTTPEGDQGLFSEYIRRLHGLDNSYARITYDAYNQYEDNAALERLADISVPSPADATVSIKPFTIDVADDDAFL